MEINDIVLELGCLLYDVRHQMKNTVAVEEYEACGEVMRLADEARVPWIKVIQTLTYCD